jgi:hypothetical protein
VSNVGQMRVKSVSNGKWNGMELYKRAIYSIPVSTENYNVYSIGKLAIMQEGELDNMR